MESTSKVLWYPGFDNPSHSFHNHNLNFLHYFPSTSDQKAIENFYFVFITNKRHKKSLSALSCFVFQLFLLAFRRLLLFLLIDWEFWIFLLISFAWNYQLFASKRLQWIFDTDFASLFCEVKHWIALSYCWSCVSVGGESEKWAWGDSLWSKKKKIRFVTSQRSSVGKNCFETVSQKSASSKKIKV